MSNLTAKQIAFCENYIITRDIKQLSSQAGYSESYSKSKAYELLQDERIVKKIHTLETEHNQNHFKRLSIVANEQLENILVGADTDSTKLRAIELVYKLSGVIQDDKISLNINNHNKVGTIDDIYNTRTLDDFYDVNNMSEKEVSKAYLDLIKSDTKAIVNDTLQEFDKEY